MANEQVRVNAEGLEDDNRSLQVEERRNAEVEEISRKQDEIDNAAAQYNKAESPLEQTVHPGWIKLPEEELPQATYWPVIMALAITLFVFGFITTIVISIVGLILFVVSLIGWIGDMRNESEKHHE